MTKKAEIKRKIVMKWIDYLKTHEYKFDEPNFIFDSFDIVELARPFVIRDINKGVGKKIILDRYGITEGEYRGIGVRAGMFKRSRF